MTTFSETVMFEIKCNLYLNHFYAEQICFRAMVTINTQWSNPSTRSSTKSRRLIFFQSILFRSCIVHFDCARGHSDLHLCVCLSVWLFVTTISVAFFFCHYSLQMLKFLTHYLLKHAISWDILFRQRYLNNYLL